jgi:hypothetical protein
VALSEKIYDEEPILTIFSNIGEDVHCTIPLFQFSVRCEKYVATVTLCRYLETIIEFK